MATDLFSRLIRPSHGPSIFFRPSAELDVITRQLREQNIAIFEVNGSAISSELDLYKAFAKALMMPQGWYGQEEYAPNADAFLEYLGDVAEWVPAKAHVVLVRQSDQLWRTNPQVAGLLTELCEDAALDRESSVRLVFVW